MSKKTKWIVFGLLAAAAIIASVMIYNLATASPKETFAFVVPKAISNKLPSCIPSAGDCRWKLWRVQRQAVNSQWMSWDFYAQYKGQLYHAHGYRTGDTTRWLWVIDGHPYWLKAIRRYKELNPTHVTQGPALLENIRKDQSVCDVVAPLIFVNITTDGGALQQPNPVRHSCNSPTDGGVPGDCTVTTRLWPDGGAVANCNGAYWLARCRFGGSQASSQAEEDAGFLTDAPAASGSVGGVQQAVDPSQWVAPDARTIHQCTLPVGTPCP